MAKSWRCLSGFMTHCFVEPEPQCVTKIFGPVKSFYRRAQIVVVEQWRRVTKLGEVVATDAYKQIANRLSRVRVWWRRHTVSEPAHRLTPDFLSRSRKRQPLRWLRYCATKMSHFGIAEV